MSGGSYSYIYSRLLSECEGNMYDTEMDDMIRDLAEVLHDLEWWQSADTSEDKYRATLARFKAKWFKGNRKERLKGYIDDQIGIARNQLYALIGEPTEAEIQKMQEMEQAEIQKSYELGKAERPRIGHWNTYKLSQGGIDEEWLECSECMWSNALLIPRNYCPNCGAKMEEVEK